MTARAPLVAAVVVVFVALPLAGLCVVLLATLGGDPDGGCLGAGGRGGGGRFSTGCLDDGASGLPLATGPVGRTALPRNFALPGDHRARAAVAFALAAVGKPYVFGAKGPAAYDCSGLTQAAWAAAGVGISAGTLSQIHDGSPVTSLADLSAGDLLFIPGSLGTPATPRHVGIYAGHGLVVDAYDTTHGVIRERLADWEAQVVAVRHIGG